MYIVVRPPPAKTNHPLNLQLQLVPPQQARRAPTADRTANRRSVDYSQSSDAVHDVPMTPMSGLTDESLRRINSNKSNFSDRSGVFYSSASSVGSVSSFASNAGGARRIVPLYNLSAHNVITNTVTDAGTDAKVAKFLKRGLEVIGVGTWEPVEVWGGSNDPFTPISRQGTDVSTMGPVPTSASASQLSSPSVQDLSLAGQSSPPYPIMPSTPTMPSSTSAKKLFGKMFKRKDSPSSSSTTPTRSFLSPSPNQSPLFGKRRSAASFTDFVPPSPSPSIISQASVQSISPTQPEPLLQPPILGLQAILIPSPPGQQTGRPTKYVWVLRKWAKEKTPGGDSLLRGITAGMNAVAVSFNNNSRDAAYDPNAVGDVELRFEWVRGSSASKKREHRKERSVSRRTSDGEPGHEDDGVTSSNHSRTSLAIPVDSTLPSTSAKTRSLHRLSKDETPSMILNDSHHPRSSSPQTLAESHDPAHDVDDGEESDPEDSETPWTCTLHIHPSHTPSGSPGSPSPSSDGRVKLRLANLVPAPHHPKVIAQFKMPFPLPDIAIVPRNHHSHQHLTPTLGSPMPSGAGARLLPRTLQTDGSIQHAQHQAKPNEVLLTAEDIKDVVSSTGMWLIVREGFGGVGRTKRKGDGWRIRA